MLDKTNAKFAMAKTDIMVSVHDGGARREGFSCGEVYSIIDKGDDRYAYNDRDEKDKYKYYLPIGTHDAPNNEFMKKFIFVENPDVLIAPYSDIRLLRQQITDKRNKHSAELKPILERHSIELEPLMTKFRKLREAIGLR